MILLRKQNDEKNLRKERENEDRIKKEKEEFERQKQIYRKEQI